ncbi:hypothetical protein [Blastopirellula marina]|nr:hypothetical protein [Blastopirellula marina]
MEIRFGIICTTWGGTTAIFRLLKEYWMLGVGSDLEEVDFTLQVSPCLAQDSAALSSDEIALFGKCPALKRTKSGAVLELRYLSKVVTARDVESTKLNPTLTNLAMGELLSQLESFELQLQKYAQFDVDRFLGLTSNLFTAPIESMEHAQNIEQAYRELPQATRNLPLMPEPEAHPDALKLLPDPFYWSYGDSFSPHGSDIGIDVWNAYRDRRINTGLPTIEFLHDMIGQYRAEDDAPTRFVIVLAVAFAEIKMHACICPILREMAIEEISRCDPKQLALPDFVPELRVALDRMREKLEYLEN